MSTITTILLKDLANNPLIHGGCYSYQYNNSYTNSKISVCLNKPAPKHAVSVEVYGNDNVDTDFHFDQTLFLDHEFPVGTDRKSIVPHVHTDTLYVYLEFGKDISDLEVTITIEQIGIEQSEFAT